MKVHNLKFIPFMLIGFFLGGASYKYTVQSKVENSLEQLTRNEWNEAKNYLVIAKAIRDKRYNDALRFSEGMIESKVETFSAKYTPLSEFESSILGQIRDYKTKDCSMNCLPRIK
ncbi:hypothetical protein L4D00_22520 [Photobacterium swingsii]|uniref:hypothetical protein n=1 Tax=Photobacterium swingsii TaxID=680026 RepID=UPI003D0EF414